MRIGIDARFYGPIGTGIGRTLVELLPRLERLDQENEYVIFLKKENFDLYHPQNPNFKKVLTDISWYSLSEQIKLPKKLAREKLDLLHVPHLNVPIFYPGKLIVTIHDLIISDHKTQKATTKNFLTYNLKHFGYQFVLNQAVKKAQLILVPSQSVKTQVLGRFDIPDKVRVVYEASDPNFNNDFAIDPMVDHQIRNELKVGQHFILYVGNAFPHKNLETLLKAMTKVDQDIKLVLVTPWSKFATVLKGEIKGLGLQDRVVLPGYLSDQDLKYLYRLASVYVFPSLAEGFGLPGLEAMASGLPVICSDIPVFKEIYGEAAIYFNPQSPEDLASRIELVVKEEGIGREYVKKGLEQAAKYNWDRFAQETHQVYLEVLD